MSVFSLLLQKTELHVSLRFENDFNKMQSPTLFSGKMSLDTVLIKTFRQLYLSKDCREDPSLVKIGTYTVFSFIKTSPTHQGVILLIYSSLNFYHPMGKFSRRQNDDIFFYFSQKIGFDISCKLSPEETICMMCQSLFFWKFF